MRNRLGILRETCGGYRETGCWDATHMKGILDAARVIGACDTCLVQAALFLACSIWQELERADSRELLGFTWVTFEDLRTRLGRLEARRAVPEKLGDGADGRTFTGPNVGFSPCYPDHCDDPEAHRLELVDIFHDFVLGEGLCARCAIHFMLYIAGTAGMRMGMEEAECLVTEIETTLLELESHVSVGN